MAASGNRGTLTRRRNGARLPIGSQVGSPVLRKEDSRARHRAPANFIDEPGPARHAVHARRPEPARRRPNGGRWTMGKALQVPGVVAAFSGADLEGESARSPAGGVAGGPRDDQEPLVLAGDQGARSPLPGRDRGRGSSPSRRARRADGGRGHRGWTGEPPTVLVDVRGRAQDDDAPNPGTEGPRHQQVVRSWDAHQRRSVDKAFADSPVIVKATLLYQRLIANAVDPWLPGNLRSDHRTAHAMDGDAESRTWYRHPRWRRSMLGSPREPTTATIAPRVGQGGSAGRFRVEPEEALALVLARRLDGR